MADPKDGPVESEHIGEGAAHAWLDGQLTAADAERAEAHIAECAACAGLVAEARGFVAASSRILTGLDGVPARVVPRARPRARVWQIRAAAAVVVVALGAAAVWSDPGGRLSELTRVAGLSDQPVVAPPAPARAPADTTAAASRGAAVARAPASDSPSAGLRAAPLVRQSAGRAAPPPVPQSSAKTYASKKQTARAGDDSGGGAMATQPAASQGTASARNTEDQIVAPRAAAIDTAARSTLASPGLAGGVTAATPQLARKASPLRAPGAAPPPVGAGGTVGDTSIARGAVRDSAGQRAAYLQSREAVVAAQSARGGDQLDAKTAINNASAVDLRWSPAYGLCAGRTVTIPVDSSSIGGSIAGRTVRLDSARAVFTNVGGFVASSPDRRDTSVRGVWVPVGADSAVVSLAAAYNTTVASSRDATRSGNAVASGVVSARLRCVSP
jgi:hypothetical protein